MTDLVEGAGQHHKKSVHGKRSFGRYPAVDSPAYDASEEDNDPLTDDAASALSIPPPSNTAVTRPSPPSQTRSGALIAPPGTLPSPSQIQSQSQSQSHSRSSRPKHQLAASVISDDGVDSPTYDGDIESSTATHPSVRERGDTSSQFATSHLVSSTSTLTSPATSTHPLPRSSLHPGPAPAPSSSTTNNPSSSHQHHYHHRITPMVIPVIAPGGSTASSSDVDNIEPVTVTTTHAPLGSTTAQHEPEPVAAAQDEFDPSALAVEDIQGFVRKAIDESHGGSAKYKINEPPTDRPVRIYADGVYDLFHFGHALQLRQAKLSFPDVYLLVGVNSDELVKQHKANTVMRHSERCEAVRHCRWVDQVVPEAPWILDAEFIEKYQIDYVAHDDNPYVSAGHDDVYAFAKSQGKFIPTRRTPGVSTSELLERIVKRYRKRDFDKKLAGMGHEELMAQGSDYDDER